MLKCLVTQKKSTIDRKGILTKEVLPEYMKKYWKSTPG